MKSLSDVLAPLNLTCKVKQYSIFGSMQIILSLPLTGLSAIINQTEKSWRISSISRPDLNPESIRQSITLQTETLWVLQALIDSGL